MPTEPRLPEIEHGVDPLTIRAHFEVDYARRGLIHSHASTGTYVTVTILERS